MPDAIGSITQRMAQLGARGMGGVGGVDTGAIKVPIARPGQGEGPSFGDTLKKFVTDVSGQQDAAGELRDKFLRGEPVEMHQVMAAGTEASLSLELMIALRDKVTEAYKTLVNIQS